ncbi:MAG: LamG-like jellyroll fold domain-containing protein, partial [Planctomycetota bacterium]
TEYIESFKNASQLGVSGNNERTVTAWVYARAFDTGGVFRMGPGQPGELFALRTDNVSNNWQVLFFGSSIDFTVNPSLNTWVHFAVTYDDEVVVYADGQRVGSLSIDLNTTDATSFMVGEYGGQRFNGIVDDVRVYSRCLSQSEVQSIMAGANLGGPGSGGVSPSWLVQGNRGLTEGVDNFIGTIDNVPLNLIVAGAPAMRIDEYSIEADRYLEVTATGTDARPGVFDAVVGVMGEAESESMGAEDAAVGGNFEATLAGTGDLMVLAGLRAKIRSEATAAGTVAEAASVWIDDMQSGGIGTITDTYGVKIGSLTVPNQTNLPYAIYSTDSNARTYLAGNLGIKATDPGYGVDVDGALRLRPQMGEPLLPAGEKGVLYMDDEESLLMVSLDGMEFAEILTAGELPWDTSLKGWWELDEESGGIAPDAAGPSDGTLFGTPTWLPSGGVRDGALQFVSANSDYVHIPHSANIHPTSAITVACWAKSATPTWNATMVLVSKDLGYIIRPASGSTQVSFYIYAGAVWRAATDVPAIDITQWHHYAGTFDGSTVTLYVDGAPVATQPYVGTIDATSSDLFIGCNGIPSAYFDGVIDDVRVYDRALADWEVNDLTNMVLPGPVGPTWLVEGNSGLTDGDDNFLGTTDDVALNVIVGGERAMRYEPHATSPNVIGGHADNVAVGPGATIAGGGMQDNGAGAAERNYANGMFSTIGGGGGNTIDGGLYSTIAGGRWNDALSDYATVGGGIQNVAGDDGTVTGSATMYATVPGGYRNEARGHNSFAAGRQARANHHGTFVWADNLGVDFVSSGDNQFLIRATGGVGVGVTAPTAQLDVARLTNQNMSAISATMISQMTDGSTSDWASALRVAADSSAMGTGTDDEDVLLAGTFDATLSGSTDGFAIGGARAKVVNNSTGTVTHAVGFVVEDMANSGLIENTYGVLIHDVSPANVTNAYAILSTDPDARIAFMGNVGIGISDPNSKLDVNGGLTMRLAAAPTTPASTGVVYFDGTKFKVNENDTGWVDLVPTGGAVGGSGTENYLAKFDATGKALGDSAVYDDGAGKVGIGTTNPGAALQVAGADIWQSAIGIKNTTNSKDWRLGVGASGGNLAVTQTSGVTFTPLTIRSDSFSNALVLGSEGVGIGTSGPVALLHVQGEDATSDVATFMPGVGGSMRVGIGTAAPTGRLHVTTTTEDASIRVTNSYSGSVHWGIYSAASGGDSSARYGVVGTGAGAGTAYGLYGNATGTQTNYGVFAEASGGLANWAGYFQGNTNITADLRVDSNTLFVDSAADAVGVGTVTPAGLFHVQGADSTSDVAIFMPGTGGTLRVGIGTTTPGYELDVDGALRLRQQTVAPTLTGSEQGVLFMDDNDDKLKVSLDGSNFVEILTAGEHAPELEGWWRFEEGAGTITADSSGNGRDAALLGGMTAANWTTLSAEGTYALNFNALANDYLHVGSYAGVLGGASRTVCAWVKTGDAVSDQTVVSWGNALAEQAYALKVYQGRLRVSVDPAAGSGFAQNNTTPIADNAWHHIAAVLVDDGSPDVSEVALYLDGAPASTDALSPRPVNTIASIFVRMGTFLSLPAQYFNGSIDGVVIYGKALTPAEIQDVFNQTTPNGTSPAWLVRGNEGLTDGVDNLIGTKDNVPFNVIVNNQRALRIVPNATSPSAIGGYFGNTVTAGVPGATIGGGGSLGSVNSVTAGLGTVAGGAGNTAGSYAAVGGGLVNAASSTQATVGGGWKNTASGIRATVGGGSHNEALAAYSTIAGGGSWVTTEPGANTTNNVVYDNYGTIGGGGYNRAGTVAGGTTDAPYATVGGGLGNLAQAKYAVIAGGGPADDLSPDTANNIVYDNYGVISGGGLNRAGTGDADPANAVYATVGGGYNNRAFATGATVGGGGSNVAWSTNATIGGGGGNWVFPGADFGTVGGGQLNEASGIYSTVPGGVSNVALGGYSIAMGRRAKANATGALAWADSADFDFTAGTINEFAARATGGFRFVTGLNAGVPDKGVQVLAQSSTIAPVGDASSDDRIAITRTTNAIDGIEGALEITLQSTGTVGVSFGTAITFGLQNDGTPDTVVEAAGIAAIWENPVEGFEAGKLAFGTAGGGDVNIHMTLTSAGDLG